MKPTADIYDLGQVEYGQAFDLQKLAVRRMLMGELTNTVLLLEHPPVYTIGRSGGGENVLIGQAEREKLGIALFDVDRGGDVTYHGPGQLVGYPILHLKDWKNDVRDYLRLLEDVIIRLLAGYGITAGRKEGMTGAWVGDEKICAVGVKANRDTANQGYISSHGFAINIDPDLSHFGYIVPCGITQFGVTSLRKVLGRPVDMQEVKQRWIAAFAEVFGVATSVGTALASELSASWA
ncbi:lipoyl(octanoyl) transferase LipB [Tumebacillus permanentifrigoris]|uniref:Octanoyltransferase n=1 Tax=Tumebacillus permanentifrigoris TaxID=378543 RepID=A0A316D481_9BACL|nr:lipoyl(octanoyl) transferase LipB [Tumebacillus permanentifrigoris]PWK05204.1 lipoyl(octanoyl) transferase [Tumebacillus permanentifrigoris]